MSYKLQMIEEFDCTTSINEAFNYIIDFSRIDEWDHTVISSEKTTEGELGLGTKFSLVLASGKRRVPLAYEVTGLEAPNFMELTGVSNNFTAVDTVKLRATNEGCHVDWQTDLEFTGLMRWLAPLMQKKIKANGAQTIRDLAVVLSEPYRS